MSSGYFVGQLTFWENTQALAVFSGGSVAQLEASATVSIVNGVWVQDATGTFRLLVVGGPAFINDQFRASFPTGFAANTAVTLVRTRR